MKKRLILLLTGTMSLCPVSYTHLSCCPFEAVQIPWQRETPGPSGPGDRFPWFGTWEEGDYGCS